MNKRYLLEALEREMSRSRRQQTQLAVVMFDIDHFKRINDTHGHLAGDEVLREFGRRIIAVCRADDLMARYGGEEFSLVLCGSTREEALDMAERCRQTIGEKPFLTAVGELAITASFGVAVFDQETHLEPTDLLQAADRCLYAAKSDGRNCVCG
jgi:diguanylate cyclase (GGDEF)-like protein